MTPEQIAALSPKVGEDRVDGKIVYSAREMVVVDAKLRWPNHPDVKEGDVFLAGESFVHDGWHPIRTSPITHIDRENNLVHTRNSVYLLTDAQLKGYEDGSDKLAG